MEHEDLCQTRRPKAQPHDILQVNQHPADILRLPHILGDGGHWNTVKTEGNVYKERGLISAIKPRRCLSPVQMSMKYSTLCINALAAMTK